MRTIRLSNPIDLARALLAAAAMLSAGCSSVISMRDALRESVEQAAAMTQLATLGDLEPHASEIGPTDIASYDREGVADEPTAAELADSLTDDPAAVAAAIEQAISDLAAADSLDAASKAALIETLQLTPQADWPVVIEEFTATLTALRAAAPAATEETAGLAEPTTVAAVTEPAVIDEPAEPPATEPAAPPEVATAETSPVEASTPADPVSTNDQPAEAPAPANPAVTVSAEAPEENSAVATADASQSATTPAESTPASGLSIDRPCLARQVRGWGQVDRFDPADLHPGGEVIAYFELSGLQSRPTAAGVTTSIDTTLRLEDGQGNRLAGWSFPPVTETCTAQRRDYFARYLLDLPADLPAGEHRLILAVTDLQAGSTAETSIALPVTAE